MELIIGNRYVLIKQLVSLTEGFIYSAKDMSLRREVLLFIAKKPWESAADAYFKSIGEAARIDDNRFIPILDAGIDKEYVFVSLHACEGQPLISVLDQTVRTSQDILAIIFDLGRGLQEAKENHAAFFSVTAENIWSHNGTYKFIQYWSEDAKNRQGVRGLCFLLYQLCARSSEIPADIYDLEQQIRTSMKDLPAAHLQKLLAIVRRAMNGEESLSAFLFNMHELLIGQEALPHSGLPPKEAGPMEKQEPVLTEEVDEEPEEEADEKAAGRTRNKTSRKVIFITGLSFICLVLIAGIMIQKTRGIDHAHVRPSPTSTAGKDQNPPNNSGGEQQEKPAVTPTPKPKEEDKGANEQPNPDSDQPADEDQQPDQTGSDPEQAEVAVPDLFGLTQQEAEQLLLSKQLKYKFFIENDDHPQGTVFNQEPAADEEVPKGTRVTFWVSR